MGTKKYASFRFLLHMKSPSCKISLIRCRPSILKYWYGIKVSGLFRFMTGLFPISVLSTRNRLFINYPEEWINFWMAPFFTCSWTPDSLIVSVRHLLLLNGKVCSVLAPSRMEFHILLKLTKFPDQVPVSSTSLEPGLISQPSSNLAKVFLEIILLL